MKRIIASLLALLFLIQPAFPTTMLLTGAGAGGPTSTPVSTACITVSGTTITFTAQGTGGANANRVSVVTIAWDDSTLAGTSELTAMTIGGISMTRAVRAVGDNQNSNSEIWYASNPTGTTANIVATFSTAVDGITIAVYSLIGFSFPAATQTGTTTVTQPYDNKQLAIAVSSRRINVSTSLSNMVNDFSAACGANLWGTHASQRLNGNGGSLTTTINPTSNTPLIALVKWTVGFVASCAESSAFIARTSGLDNAHKLNYDTLICGLVTDSLWTKIDVLRIYATNSSANAVLNLKSSSYTGTINGSPTFTVDRGFTGTDSSTTIYINSGFNPSTAGGQYTQNQAHMAAWFINTAAHQPPNGYSNTTGIDTYVWPRFSGDGNAYLRINANNAGNGANPGSYDGFFIGYRNGVSLKYNRNGTDFFNGTVTAQSLLNLNFYELGYNSNGTASGSGSQQAFYSIGALLSGTDITNYYNRVRTYMTAVGVP